MSTDAKMSDTKSATPLSPRAVQVEEGRKALRERHAAESEARGRRAREQLVQARRRRLLRGAFVSPSPSPERPKQTFYPAVNEAGEPMDVDDEGVARPAAATAAPVSARETRYLRSDTAKGATV